jgi:hypothetical protein
LGVVASAIANADQSCGPFEGAVALVPEPGRRADDPPAPSQLRRNPVGRPGATALNPATPGPGRHESPSRAAVGSALRV